MESGALFDSLSLPHLSLNEDRVMICGSMNMNQDMKQLCLDAGLQEGANSAPGHFVLEKAFVG
jgi:ferredoxin--NADP+ reductase